MKKLLSIFIVFTFTLYANDPTSIDDVAPNEQPLSDAPAPLYAPPNPPIDEKQQQSSNSWKATGAIVGTLIAITLGLVISGKSSKNHPHQENKGG